MMVGSNHCNFPACGLCITIFNPAAMSPSQTAAVRVRPRSRIYLQLMWLAHVHYLVPSVVPPLHADYSLFVFVFVWFESDHRRHHPLLLRRIFVVSIVFFVSKHFFSNGRIRCLRQMMVCIPFYKCEILRCGVVLV